MMNWLSEDDQEARRRLIQHYLEGKLPDWADTWVEDQIQADTAFRDQVIAQRMVGAFFENQEFEEAAQEEFEKLAVVLKVHKRRSETKGFPLLYLLLAGAACLCLVWAGGYLVNSRPVIYNKQAYVDNESYGFSNSVDSIQISFFDRKPGFWRPGNEYNWKGDTLQLFGHEVFEKKNKPVVVTQSMYRDYYILDLDNVQYLIYKEQLTRIPMKTYESNP